MLKDLVPSLSYIESVCNTMKKHKELFDEDEFKINIGVHPSCHLETGIYECQYPIGFTFMANFEQKFKCMDKYNNKIDNDGTDSNHISPYGVADSIEQIKDYYQKAIEDEEHDYFIYVNKIIQKEEPSKGGWRWHKWGPYIGNLNPKHEYIHDENFGDDWQGFVYCFNIIEIN